MSKIIESTSTTPDVDKTGARARITIITPGQGSSGYYPAEVIAEAAPLFASGTHMYLDHASEDDRRAYPAGSLSKLVGVLESDAQLMGDGSLEADVKIFPTHREFIKEAAPYIGVSISGDGSFTESAEHGRMIERLTRIDSVDFVTKAGRGGKVNALLEHSVSEATNNDVQRWLRETLHGMGDYELEDFTTDTAYYRDWQTSKTYQRSFTVNGASIEFTSDPVEVNRETVFHPTNGAGEPTNEPTQEAEGMGNLTITESEYKRLTEAEAQAKAASSTEQKLMAQIEKLKADLEKAQAQLAAEQAKAKESAVRAEATQIVEEAFKGVNAPRGKARLVEAAVTGGEFDAEAFRKTAVEEASEYGAAPTVTGMGATTGATWHNVTEGDVLEAWKA